MVYLYMFIYLQSYFRLYYINTLTLFILFAYIYYTTYYVF